jgi:hypothetical protein
MDSEKTVIDMLVANAAIDAQRHIVERKFLEGEIKTLIGAIRTAPDLQSLRVVANHCVERLREHKRGIDAKRLENTLLKR